MKGINALVEVLTQAEIEAVHKSTLDILENTGVRIPNEECLKACKKLGAHVDWEDSAVKIPAPLLEEVLASVRNSQWDKKAGQVKKLKGTISTQVFYIDYKTGTKRYGLMDDVMKGIALLQRLDNFPVANAIVIPSDIPYNMTDVASHRMIYSYSEKRGGTYILSAASAKYIIEMAKVRGERLVYLLETVSPLQFRKESLDIAMVFAKSGQALGMGPMVMSGATGPVTTAGTITLQNAEVVASLFLIYALIHDSAAYISGTHSMDLKTMLCSFGSPNQALFGMCIAQMSRHYGLESITNAGLTDALAPDFQCGYEKALNAIFSCLAGTAGIGCQGIVGADQGFSLEQLVMDNEWLDAYNYVLGGVEVSEETIAAGIINQVGIGGNFLAQEHTAEHMRGNYWKPRLFNRENWDNWKSAGSISILDKAHEFVEEATQDYRNALPVITGSEFDRLLYIEKNAEKELAKGR